MKKSTATILKYSLISGLFSMLLISGQALASDLPSGDEIAAQINKRDEGNAVSRNLLMEMTDNRGKKRTRDTRSFRKYYGEEKRTVLFYLSPSSVKDTGFLTFDYPQVGRDDDQWLYLPAMRKVRRISASNRGDYFLGTDFTYEDIKKESKVSIEDYTRTTLREELLDGVRTYVIESVPVNEDTAKELGYGRIVQWVDADIWMVRKAEYQDVRGNALKTIYTRDIRQVQDIWTSHRLQATNHKTGHKTLFTFSDVDYQSGVKDSLFSQRTLKRGM